MRMLAVAAGLALAVVAAGDPRGRSPGARDAEGPLSPFSMRDDLQGDGLAQWASYPPAQDVGYEPSLAPTARFGARGGRSLMRVVRPTVVGPLRLGFIKHVPFIAARDTRISFACRLEAPGSVATVDVALAGSAGRLFRARATATTGAWTDVRLAMADFAADASPIREREDIEAITIVATVEHASPDVTYRFLLDDVTIAASRPAAFTVVTPATQRLNPWSELVTETGYRSGSTVSVEVVAPVAMARVTWSVGEPAEGGERTAPLFDDGTHGDRTAGDGRWSNEAVHVFPADARPGVRTRVIRGEAASGGTVRTELRLMVHGPRTARPRLYVGEADRAALASRTRHARFAKLWPQMQERARTSRTGGDLVDGARAFDRLDTEYLLPSLPAYFDVVNRARQRIATNAFVGWLERDADAVAAARDALTAVSRWHRWAPPWFDAHGQHTYYPAGQLAAAVALAYDLLHDQLTGEERRAIRTALIERSILPTWREYVLDNRVMAHTSNWIAHTVAGALIAAAAIEGDTTPEEQGRIEAAVHGLLLKIESHMAASFLPDGSYGEGISYQEFDLETLGPMLHALERVFGIDYWSRTGVLGSLAYPLATLATPTPESLDMGDTHAPAGHGIAAIVSRSKDPVVGWYAARFEPRTLEDLIFFDDQVAPTAPAPPGSRLFANKGNIVFRTGWGEQDAVLLFRAGPTFNHNHADQGAFLFRALGETLATEAGWADYYKDPYYTSFFTQAVGHNTVLVDGDPESQAFADTAQFRALDSYPRIADTLLTDTYDAVTSDLTPVYKGRLSRYTRRLVFLKPDYLFVHDDLQASGAPATFDWLLHLPDRLSVSASEANATYSGRRASLAVRSLLGGARFDVREGRLPYATLATRMPSPVPAQPAYLDLRISSPASRHQFLVALVPAGTKADAAAAADRLVPLDEDPWRGVRVTRGTTSDVVLFRTRAATGAGRFEGWSVDADAWSATRQGSALVQVSGHNLMIIQAEGRLVVRADRPISLVARYTPAEVTVTTSATGPTSLQLALAGDVASVELDGASVRARVERGGGSVTVDVPAGSHQLRIRRR